MSGETQILRYLGHMCSQKSGVAEVCDTRENKAEAVVKELR